MCGIVGYIGSKNAPEILFDGLKRLEYRGYDSAGIAIIKQNEIVVRKCEGKLKEMEKFVKDPNFTSTVGIGHTRWATHGRPSELNAHPHLSCKNEFAVVHNGIIENYLQLKQELISKGHTIKSQTDTEIVVHLIEEYYKGDFFDAVINAIKRLEGAYALGILSKENKDEFICVRKESPLIIGLGKGENYIASDIPAILPYTKDIILLDNDEIGVLTRESIKVFNKDGKEVKKDVTKIEWSLDEAEKGGYKHFMLKEIFEQPKVISNTIGGRITKDGIDLSELNLDAQKVKNIKRIFIVSCGTAYYSGMVGKYLIEKYSRIPCELDLASEFRYRQPVIEPNNLMIVITQSGETADTIAAMREAKRQGAHLLGIVNAKGSTIAREVDSLLYIHAGPEIGVASTKAYIAMVTAVLMLSLDFGLKRGTITEKFVKEICSELKKIPKCVEKQLSKANIDYIISLAKTFKDYPNFLFLGRGTNYPTALEGALKLKEISYIHAEGYAAGEMKHGPIALIDSNMPVVCIATKGELYEKMLSNIEEVRARAGIIIAVATEGDEEIKKYSKYIIYVPDVPEILTPIVNVVYLQLFAYYVADMRGCDVDQPRNLAKSVTVE